jgi:hypothetical protein
MRRTSRDGSPRAIYGKQLSCRREREKTHKKKLRAFEREARKREGHTSLYVRIYDFLTMGSSVSAR